MPESDEEIRIRIRVEDAGAVETTLEIRAAMEELTRSARAVATELNETLPVAFAGVRADKIEELTDALEQARGILKQERSASPIDEDAVTRAENLVKELTNELNIYKKAGSLAYTEVRQEATKFSQVLSNLGKVQRASTESSITAQREWEKATKQGLSQMSAAANQYGVSVGKVSQIIQNTAQRSGQSFQQVANHMTQLGVPINLVNSAMNQLNATVQQVANNIKKTAQNTGQTFQQVAQQLQSFGIPINTINAALRQLSSQVQQTQSGFQGFINSLGNLGSVVQYVIGGSLAYLAVRVLRDVYRYLQEATKAAIDFSQSLFQLEIGIRGLQRVGIDTTFQEFAKFIQDIRKEFPIFSRKDVTDAVSIATLMTREFGFTADQIKEVVRVSTLMSIVTGKDLTEAVRGVTYAVGAGYFEALQRVGVNISRATIAQEALRRGLKGSYNDLDQTTRAALTLEVVLENLAALEEDAADITEVSSGKVRSLQSAWDDFTLLLGEKTLPILNEIVDVLTIDLRKAIEYFERIPGVYSPEEIEQAAQKMRELGLSEEFIASQTKILLELWEEFGNKLDELDGKNVEVTVDVKVNYEGMEFTSEEIENISKATQKLGEEITDIELKAEEDRIDTINKYLDDKEDLEKEHNQRLEDIEIDHQKRLDDIGEKAIQKRADEDTDYAYRISDVIRDAAQRREDAERKYRERELREERKFQEKMRQLRENFLLDLEDAVRERDARQIIRLTRQYNLRRDQMVREEKLSKEDRQAAFQEELRDIERQREERLRQLAIEHQRRIDAINLQAEREAAQEEIEYQRRQAAEDERYTDAQNKRSDRLNEQLNSINEATQDRINAMILGLQEEYDLTDEQLQAMLTLWQDYHGKDGYINQAIAEGVNAAIVRMNMLATYALRLRALLATAFPGTNVNDMNRLRKELQSGYDLEDAGGQAEGGTIIARKPTVAIFGEAGPEMATFTPLSDVSSTSPAKIMPSDLPTGKDGLIRLEMLLSPDLEARVIDNTLSEIADVNFRIERARK